MAYIWIFNLHKLVADGTLTLCARARTHRRCVIELWVCACVLKNTRINLYEISTIAIHVNFVGHWRATCVIFTLWLLNIYEITGAHQRRMNIEHPKPKQYNNNMCCVAIEWIVSRALCARTFKIHEIETNKTKKHFLIYFPSKLIDLFINTTGSEHSEPTKKKIMLVETIIYSAIEHRNDGAMPQATTTTQREPSKRRWQQSAMERYIFSDTHPARP